MSTISVHNLPKLYTSKVDRTNKRKWLNTIPAKKNKKKQYPAETITDTDDKGLLENTTAQAKSLQHSLEQAAGGIDLHMNTNKTE